MNEPPAKCQHFLDAIAECQETGLITQYFDHYYLHPEGKVLWHGWLTSSFIQDNFSKLVDSDMYLVVYEAPHLPSGSNDFFWFNDTFASKAEEQFFNGYVSYKKRIKALEEKKRQREKEIQEYIEKERREEKQKLIELNRQKQKAEEQHKKDVKRRAERRKALWEARPKFVGLSPMQILPLGDYCLLADQPSLIIQKKSQHKARNRLILKYLPIVDYYVEYYYSALKYFNLSDKEDLRQEFIFLLIQCINTHKCKDSKQLNKYIRYHLFQKIKKFKSEHTNIDSLNIDDNITDLVYYEIDLDWLTYSIETLNKELKNTLSPRNYDFVFMCYNLSGMKSLNYTETGKRFNVSCGYVSQRIKKAFAKLRQNETIKELYENL